MEWEQGFSKKGLIRVGFSHNVKQLWWHYSVFIDLKMGPESMTSCRVICHFIFFINQMIVVVYNSLICNIPQILYLAKVGTFWGQIKRGYVELKLLVDISSQCVLHLSFERCSVTQPTANTVDQTWVVRREAVYYFTPSSFWEDAFQSESEAEELRLSS